ncbi:MAG: hypothetical protein ABSF27_03065 [Candidatus Dormibacteria bacterium]
MNGSSDYSTARFVQLIGEFFDQSPENSKRGFNSLGVVNGPKSDRIADLDKVGTDHGDNGSYLVNWTKTELSMRRFLSTPPDWKLVEQTAIPHSFGPSRSQAIQPGRQERGHD